MIANTVETSQVHELVRGRWSPRAFSNRPVAAGDLRSMLEAARWAASSRNEQPWRFLVAEALGSPETHAKILSTLVPSNVGWAAEAPVLILVAAEKAFQRNGTPNRHALYDTGAAVAQLTLQATALGLSIHQMGGFDGVAAQKVLAIPEGFEPVVVLAVGYAGDAEGLPAELRDRERAPRQRAPLEDLVYGDAWGQSWGPARTQ